MENVLLLNESDLTKVEKYMPEDEMLQNLSDFFSAFSDSTRLKILTALSLTPMCVNDLSNVLKINQTTISHQLRTLKNLRLVNYARDGKILLYSLSTNCVSDVMLGGVNHLLKESSN